MRILISGGSRGLGYQICASLLQEGSSVASFSRTPTEWTAKLSEQYPDTFVYRSLDANNEDAVSTFVKEIDEKWGGIDALINNAAIGQDSLLAHTSPDEIERIIDTNLLAPILLTRSVTRLMLRRSLHGHVLFIGSICAEKGYPGLSVYASTKGALNSFTRSLAHELKGRITVNVIAPGFFESEMSSVLLPDQLDAIMRRTPSGQLSSPEQVTKVVRFVLESDTNLNGTVFSVDGGASS